MGAPFNVVGRPEPFRRVVALIEQGIECFQYDRRFVFKSFIILPLLQIDVGQFVIGGSRSDLPSAAINEQFDTRDETGVIRRQKKHSLGDFIGFPHSAHRDGGHNSRDSLRRLSIDRGGVGRTGANDI
jgi:hypothetical protein